MSEIQQKHDYTHTHTHIYTYHNLFACMLRDPTLAICLRDQILAGWLSPRQLLCWDTRPRLLKSMGQSHKTGAENPHFLLIKYGCQPKNRGETPQIIHFNRVFHYKPFIFRYPYFWKRPYRLSLAASVRQPW